MPTYDYQCSECGHGFEMRQGFDSEPVEACPRCHGQSRRRFHSVAVIYKGSGFYTTDYARKQVSLPSKADDSVTSKSDTSKGDTSKAPSPAVSSDTSQETKTGQV